MLTVTFRAEEVRAGFGEIYGLADKKFNVGAGLAKAVSVTEKAF